MHSQIGRKITIKHRQTHLLVNYYNPDNEDRQAEINKCLRTNMKIKEFHKIHIIIGPGVSLPEWATNSKTQIVHIETNRMTYEGFFDYANENLPTDSIAIIANADIICTPSISYLRRYVNSKQCVVLRRWERVKKEWVLIPINSSQDLWAFQTPIKLDEPAAFELGVPGCDNYIAYLLSQKYELRNPAESIVTYHIHASEKRAYGPRLKGKLKRVNVE